jgi:hypothetical protein
MTSTLFKRIVNGTGENIQRVTREDYKQPYRPVTSTYVSKRNRERIRSEQADLMLFVNLVKKNRGGNEQ